MPDDHGAEPEAGRISAADRARSSPARSYLPSKVQSRLREIRGNEIAMIFQDPMTSLNPVHTIGEQLVEAVMLHKDVSKRQARCVIEGLKEVGIPRAERRIDDYPHQFSGGMRQRGDDRHGAGRDPANC